MADTPRETALSLPLTGVASSGHATADGNREAEVVALFDQLRVPLLRYLLSLGLPVQDGEEIVQESFLALFQHLGRGGASGNLRGWMFRVAHNLGLKRARRRKNWAQAPEEVVIADAAPSPEQQAADTQRQRRLLGVFRALPEQDRQCLLLRAEGLRYREIAGVLNMSLGAVSMSLARSLARLARAGDR
jgi:RNA polymerase sigma-70 factor (ECF subfamily)